MGVLLLGSSHIRRLEVYIRRLPQLRQIALNNPPVVNYHGISGGGGGVLQLLGIQMR